MSGAAGLDIRLPIGGLFTVLGVHARRYGVATIGDAGALRALDVAEREPLVGLVMLFFGLVLLLASRPSRRDASAPSGTGYARRAGTEIGSPGRAWRLCGIRPGSAHPSPLPIAAGRGLSHRQYPTRSGACHLP